MKRRILISIATFFTQANLFAQVDTIQPVRQDIIPDSLIIVDTAKAIINTSIQDTISKTELKKKTEVYTLNPAFDIPTTAFGTGWSLYAFTKIYRKGSSSTGEILALKETDVPSFDRWAIYPYDEQLDEFSYVPFYTAIPLPLVYSLAGTKTRKDFFKISFLYLEALSITGLFGTGATYFVDRYRPYTFTTETEINKRTGENAKNSFYAGHVEIIAVSTFFIAKVHHDYNPESNSNWIFFAGAAAATGWMSYARLYGGMHFPSDIILGITTGALAGILVPHFHKTKEDEKSLSVLPFKTEGGMGLSMSYKW